LGSRKNLPARWFRKKLKKQGAQKQRNDAQSRMRRNNKAAAQSRFKRDRWTFYEIIRIGSKYTARFP